MLRSQHRLIPSFFSQVLPHFLSPSFVSVRLLSSWYLGHPGGPLFCPPLFTLPYPVTWHHAFHGFAPLPGILLLPPLRRSWTCAFATAWLGLALAILRAFHAVFASPSQDRLNGFWGGCNVSRFTFVWAILCLRFPDSQGTAQLYHCVSVSLWNLYVLITIGQQVIVYNFFLFKYIHPHFLTSLFSHMRTSCSGVGAFLWDFTKALFLHLCVYLYIFPLWRRCFPSGFHQSPRLVHSILLLSFCLSRVCGWFFWPCCMFLTMLWWCMTSSCDYGHCVHNTFVSLTEGRSARDLPKQQPAKKRMRGKMIEITRFSHACTLCLFV